MHDDRACHPVERLLLLPVKEQPDECAMKADGFLKDIFASIVGNAVKHPPRPEVTVTVGMSKVNNNGAWSCKIFIEDDGPGIPDDMKTRVFDRHPRGLTKAGGRGLGLYLAKKLAERYNGRVWVEDRIPGDPGRGSGFVVELPVTL